MAESEAVKESSLRNDCAMKKDSKVNPKVDFTSCYQCPNCSSKYSENHQPVNLQCGHSVCTECINQYVNCYMPCPECSFKQMWWISYFPVNYSLLKLVTSFQALNILGEIELPPIHTSPFPSCSIHDDADSCTIHGSPILYVCCRCSRLACEDCLVLGHSVVPYGSCKIIKVSDALERLQELCQKKTNEMLADIDKFRKTCELDLGMHAFCLEHNDFHRRRRDQFIEETEGFPQELKKNSASIVENSKDRVKKIRASININKPLKEMVALAVDIDAYGRELKQDVERERKAFLRWTKIMKPYIRTALKQLVHKKKTVYGLQQNATGTRWAPLTMNKDRLLLYSLREGVPPSEGFIIPYEYVRTLIGPSFMKNTVFLEMENKAGPIGIIYIGLCEYDDPYIDQMILMCSGEMGVSYKGTCLIKYREEDGFLQGGDYENNDGTGGKPIIELNFATNRGSPQVDIGFVAAENLSTKFNIFSRFRWAERRIGNRVDGLNIKKALKLKILMHAVVKECGLFVPMKADVEYGSNNPRPKYEFPRSSNSQTYRWPGIPSDW